MSYKDNLSSVKASIKKKFVGPLAQGVSDPGHCSPASLYSISFDLEGVSLGALDTQTARVRAWCGPPGTQHFLIKLLKAFFGDHGDQKRV